MSYGTKKVVWILGAGFSRSLGGPLLNDLLSHRGETQSRARFGDLGTDAVYSVYKEGHHKDAQLWEHAEEFLEIVDLARDLEPTDKPDHRGATSQLLLDMIQKRGLAMTIRQFRDLTLRAIAAECSFDRWIDPEAEGWGPYLDWGATLTENDTVITFNYDTVIERLTKRLCEERRTKGLSEGSVVLPGGAGCPDNFAAVLKLHGSLRWGLSTRGSEKHPYSFDGHWDDHIVTGDYEALIGIPGTTKSLHRRKHFKEIWAHAKERIEGADVIVFFGYRFPPSDAQSRSELLGAIGANKQHSLRVHIVLGPDVAHHDTLRLEKMLDVTLRGTGRATVEESLRHPPPGPRSYRILKQPLLVQDFMTIMHERFLNG